MTSFEQKARFADGLTEPGESVLCAVSGGADSMALLHWLWQREKAGGLRVCAAHYEHGLRGEEIPLESRIMAIADVYDALVSRRVYKEQMSFDQADAIIEEGMGTQFDPALRPCYEAARPALEAYYSSLEDRNQPG